VCLSADRVDGSSSSKLQVTFGSSERTRPHPSRQSPSPRSRTSGRYRDRLGGEPNGMAAEKALLLRQALGPNNHTSYELAVSLIIGKPQHRQTPGRCRIPGISYFTLSHVRLERLACHPTLYRPTADLLAHPPPIPQYISHHSDLGSRRPF